MTYKTSEIGETCEISEPSEEPCETSEPRDSTNSFSRESSDPEYLFSHSYVGPSEKESGNMKSSCWI